jgi:hypothetical protein
MGEAKRRREQAVATVYHHTSTLRTNLIWMSGVVEVEGQSKPAFHPELGEIRTDALRRRSMKDFPPLAWFTQRIEVPRCLFPSLYLASDSGVVRELDVSEEVANGIAMQRVALGFPVSAIPVVRWNEHPGYVTPEGRDLNASATDAGDNPDDWYVAERPVDVLQITEFWSSASILNPKLKRRDAYIKDIHRMVTLCRERPGAYITPTWMTPKQAAALANRMKLPIQKP